MIIEQRVTIPAPAAEVWALILDVPAVSGCVPGVSGVEPTGPDAYSGTLQVRVGPIALRLEGRITVAERDPERLTARLELRGVDRRVSGSVNARTTLRLEPQGERATDLAIHTDAAVLGKIGEFGQPVMRRKADQIVEEFARNLARRLEASGA